MGVEDGGGKERLFGGPITCTVSFRENALSLSLSLAAASRPVARGHHVHWARAARFRIVTRLLYNSLFLGCNLHPIRELDFVSVRALVAVYGLYSRSMPLHNVYL